MNFLPPNFSKDLLNFDSSSSDSLSVVEETTRNDNNINPINPIPLIQNNSTPNNIREHIKTDLSKHDFEKLVNSIAERLAENEITTSSNSKQPSGFTMVEPTLLADPSNPNPSSKGISELGAQLLAATTKYDGSDKKPLSDFMLEFNQLAPLLLNKSNTGKLTKSEELFLARFLKLLLKGEALRFVENLPNSSYLTHTQLFQKLKERFRTPRNSLYYIEKLKNLQQTSTMSVTVLAEKLLHYAKLYVEASTCVSGKEKQDRVLQTAEHYLLGALRPAIFEKLVEKRVEKDFEKMIAEAKNIEEILLTIELRTNSKKHRIARIAQEQPFDKIDKKSNFLKKNSDKNNINKEIFNQKSENFSQNRPDPTMTQNKPQDNMKNYEQSSKDEFPKLGYTKNPENPTPFQHSFRPSNSYQYDARYYENNGFSNSSMNGRSQRPYNPNYQRMNTDRFFTNTRLSYPQNNVSSGQNVYNPRNGYPRANVFGLPPRIRSFPPNYNQFSNGTFHTNRRNQQNFVHNSYPFYQRTNQFFPNTYRHRDNFGYNSGSYQIRNNNNRNFMGLGQANNYQNRNVAFPFNQNNRQLIEKRTSPFK